MEQNFLITRGDLVVPCKMNLPHGGDVRRIVLGVHGFGGSMTDEIQENLAEEMALFSSAMFRFDFPAHGISPHDGRDLTVKNCVKVLTMVAGEARARFPEVEDLCIFATGFGAYVTLVALQELMELPGRVKLVVQTPSLRMDETLLNMKHISRETLRVMDKVTFRAENRPFDAYYSFYEELRENQALAEYPIPILILHGEQDAYIPMTDIHNFRRINEDSRLVIIPGASHRFLEEGAWDMVLDLTRDWFAFEQVMLADWE